MAEIQSLFGDRVIPKGLWPPRSPDLTPSDYFVWGYLKEKIYHNKPQNIEDLKTNFFFFYFFFFFFFFFFLFFL